MESKKRKIIIPNPINANSAISPIAPTSFHFIDGKSRKINWKLVSLKIHFSIDHFNLHFFFWCVNRKRGAKNDE